MSIPTPCKGLATYIVCIQLKTQMPRAHYNTVNCGKTANCKLSEKELSIAVFFRYTTRKWASDLRCRTPRAGSGDVRIDPLRFLAGCRTRRLKICRVDIRDVLVRKTEIRFGFGFKKPNHTEPSKNLTSVQTVFRQKLRAKPQFMLKLKFLNI